MERELLDMMNQLSISEYNPRMKYCDKFKFGELRKSEFIKENIDETIFMFALFKCRKSDKGRN